MSDTANHSVINISSNKGAQLPEFIKTAQIVRKNTPTQFPFDRTVSVKDREFEDKLYWFIPDCYHLIVTRALNVKTKYINWGTLSDILKLNLVILELKELNDIYPESVEVAYVCEQAVEHLKTLHTKD